MQRVTDQNYDEIVAGSGIAVILEFVAAWCETCKALERIIEELAGEREGQVLTASVDVTEAPGVAQKFGVMGVPTIVLLRGGKAVHQGHFPGVPSKAKISQMLAQHLEI